MGSIDDTIHHQSIPQVVAREPEFPPTQPSGSRNSLPSTSPAATMKAAEGDEPGPTPRSPDDVWKGSRDGGPGSPVRYEPLRGSGRSGTAYKERFDWEVYDRGLPPGRQLICRTDRFHAKCIAYALNKAFPE